MNSPGEDMETENDSEIWALYNAVGMTNKPEQQRIRLLTLISRVNSRIHGEKRAGEEKDKLISAANEFRERAREIAQITPHWKETTVLGKPGYLIQNRKLGISVPSLLTTMSENMKAFLELNMIAQNPALSFLVDEMMGFAQSHDVLDPKKKRNQVAFKQALGRYVSGGNDFWNSSEAEVLND